MLARPVQILAARRLAQTEQFKLAAQTPLVLRLAMQTVKPFFTELKLRTVHLLGNTVKYSVFSWLLALLFH
jgi:hypothetical protein